jgi:hypothetical protein
MAELRPVAGPSSPVQRHVRRVIAVVVVGLLIAIVKPWGSGPAPSTASAPAPSARSVGANATSRPSPSPPSGTYDFRAFGTNEPPPGWELWPAGSLSTFTYAMRIDMETHDVPIGEPPGSGAPRSPSPTPETTTTPTSTPLGTPSAAAVPASWPTVRVPRGSVLDLIGLNRPLGYGLHVIGLKRVEADGSVTPVRALLGPSPWSDHFTTVGYAPEATEDVMAPWPVGQYRLEVTIDPGGVRRTLEIVVEGPASASPSAAPGDAGGAGAPEGSAAP